MQPFRCFLHIDERPLNRFPVKKLLFLIFTCFLFSHARAQGIRGTITSKSGEILPYASIQVKGTSTGTMSNGEGKYEIALKPGAYELQFQYLNHQTETRKVEVSADWQNLNVALQEIAIKLAEVRIGKSKEDPAYTIMRKAIATARFHQLEVDTWSARTYVKGNFRIEKVPFLFEDALKKANLQVGTTYILESINDLNFRQPNQVTEKVVSIRSNLPPGSNPAINFARLSFYNPMLGEIVSPLSPKAFGMYRFEYLGFFNDRGLVVNKIKVTPRSKGLNVLDGTLNLIEGSWSIHSLDFNFQDETGTQYGIRQLFSPFEGVWMPVQLETTAKINILGAKGETRYITSVRNYQVKLNPRYHQIPEVVDEKIDKEIAATLRKANTPAPTQATRKQLRKMVNQLEKEDRKERKKAGEDVTVTRNWSFEIDTLARKRPSTFWEGERQVPLTNLETQGYQRADSLYKANEVKIRKDSIRNLPRFKFMQLLTGHTYRYGQRKELEWYPRVLTFESPVFDLTKGEFFNAVEGYVLKTRLSYVERLSKVKSWNASLAGRYSFARQRLNGGLSLGYTVENTSVRLSGGRNVFQFNPADPIPESLNTFYTLFQERNYMKLYEKSYLTLAGTQKLGNRLSVSAALSWQERNALTNNVSRGWVDRPDVAFTSNDPENRALANQTAFPRHQATVLTMDFSYRPLAKAAIMNGRRYTLSNRSPELTGAYRHGWTGGQSFNQIELGIRDELSILRNSFSYAVQAGAFLNKPLYFTDYRHFNGNEIIFQNPGLNNFRNLPFYRFSTANRYLEAHGLYEFRKFLLTQITPLRLYGIKESLQVHFLNTKEVNHIEIGYGFGGILKVFGAEVLGTFQNGQYKGLAFRVRTNL
ncbi:hypothetical protein BWI97_03360 [Siphonobacter sp. BAB-5405]|nr:hypothetical protein BWI97_03360 [Siphonobacter sp. BAB-5405]